MTDEMKALIDARGIITAARTNVAGTVFRAYQMLDHADDYIRKQLDALVEPIFAA